MYGAADSRVYELNFKKENSKWDIYYIKNGMKEDKRFWENIGYNVWNIFGV